MYSAHLVKHACDMPHGKPAPSSGLNIYQGSLPRGAALGPYVFVVTALNQQSAESSDLYYYPSPPTM